MHKECVQGFLWHTRAWEHGYKMIECDMGRYRIARKFHGIKFSRKLILLSFRDFIFMDSNPIAIINDVNIVSQIKILQAGTNPRKLWKF